MKKKKRTKKEISEEARQRAEQEPMTRKLREYALSRPGARERIEALLREPAEG